MLDMFQPTVLALALATCGPRLPHGRKARVSPPPRSRRASRSARRRLVHAQGSGGQGAIARRIAEEGQGRPGVLPLGRLVTLLPHATGPVAT